jgi:hypothetical protein
MLLGLGLSIPMMGGRTVAGSPPVDYVAEVQSLITTHGGWATDPADTAIVFEDTTGLDPVDTAGVDTVARFDSKFGATLYSWQNGTVAQQYLWNGASFEVDGTDDLLQISAAWNGLASATGATLTFRDQVADLATNHMIFSCSKASGTLGRYQLRVNTDGGFLLAVARTDAVVAQNFTTSAGHVVANTPFTVQTTQNYLTGAIEIFFNGVSIFTGTLADVDGINGVDATNSARCRIGLNTSNTLNDYFKGKWGCMVGVRTVLSGAGLANCRGFAERNAL